MKKHTKLNKKRAAILLNRMFGSSGKLAADHTRGSEWYVAHYGWTEADIFYTESEGHPCITLSIYFGHPALGKVLYFDPETLDADIEMHDRMEAKIRGEYFEDYLRKAGMVAVEKATADLFNLVTGKNEGISPAALCPAGIGPRR